MKTHPYHRTASSFRLFRSYSRAVEARQKHSNGRPNWSGCGVSVRLAVKKEIARNPAVCVEGTSDGKL
jgi:hypothetical protein